jgi:hypothetical protein
MAKAKVKAPKVEPSLRDKLSANFLRAIADDFAANGVAAIEKLRERSPEKYCEISARLIAAIEPKPDGAGIETANSAREIAERCLQAVGCTEPTEEQIQAAIRQSDLYIAQLELIKSKAMGEEIH